MDIVLSRHKPQLKIDWCSHEAAKYAAEHWHYAACLPRTKLVKIGVWEDEWFIGCVVFSWGATKDLVRPYGLDMTEGCELTRVALRGHATPVTRIVARSIHILRRHSPGLRLIVSFADPERGHVGAIYQAGNWIYAGMTKASVEYWYRGKRWHGRALRATYGTSDMPGVRKIMGSAKHRYLMPLDDEMRVRIAPLAKPYPKRPRATSIDSDAPAVQAGDGGASPTVALPSPYRQEVAANGE